MVKLLASGFRVYYRSTDAVPTALFFGLSFGWAGFIWWLSSSGGGTAEASQFYEYLTNGGHVVLFGALAKLLVLAWRDGIIDPLRRLEAWGVVGLVTTYGLVDEWHQSTVPGRDASIFDLGTDASAAVLVVFGARAALHDDRLDQRLFQAAFAACFVFPLLATWLD